MDKQDAVAEKTEPTATSRTLPSGPDWELPENHHATSNLNQSGSSRFGISGSVFTLRQSLAGFRDASRNRLDRILPPLRTYTPLNLKRRNFALVLLGLLLALLALVLGLAIGLSVRKRSGNRNLPLPTGSQVYNGDLTYYNPGLGACGVTSSDSDSIVAVSHTLWDSQATGSNPNANPLCGRMIRAERFDSRVGKKVSMDLKVVDRCMFKPQASPLMDGQARYMLFYRLTVLQVLVANLPTLT